MGRRKVNEVPLGPFSGNQSYANFIGVKTRFTNGDGGNPSDEAIAGVVAQLQPRDSFKPEQLAASTNEDLTVWSNYLGILASYTTMGYSNVLDIGPTECSQPLTNIAATEQPSAGFWVTGPRELTFSNLQIVNYQRALYFQPGGKKPTTPAQEQKDAKLTGATMLPSRIFTSNDVVCYSNPSTSPNIARLASIVCPAESTTN